MRTAVFVTARNKSTRLRRKVSLTIVGKSLLELVIERVGTARVPDEVILCTSSNPDDDNLIDIASRAGARSFRGDEEDVLVRYLEAAKWAGVDAFAVTWGDEVLCDPIYLDRVLSEFTSGEKAPDLVVVNGLPEGTYCYGVCVAALAAVVRTKTRRDTEVWLAYFEKGEYEIRHLEAEPRHRRTDLRLTCDYPEDFELLIEVYRRLGHAHNTFPLDEVIALLDAEPELRAINAHRQAEYLERINEQSVDE